MKDFIRFLRHLWQAIHFLRGVILSLLLLLFICATVIAIAEGMRIRTAIYFVLVTALTIGYGDITPQTALGRAASVAAGIIGIVSTGIIVAIATRALQRAFVDEQPAEQSNPRADREDHS